MDELISATAVVYDDPHRDLDRLIRHQVEFAIGHRHLVNVYQREDRSLAEPWRRHFDRRTSQYASRWETALQRSFPGASPPHIAARTQAAIGLILSVAYWPLKVVKGDDDIPDLLCRLVTQGLAPLEQPAVRHRSSPRRARPAARAPERLVKAMERAAVATLSNS